jgi:predicted glycosyltransferase
MRVLFDIGHPAHVHLFKHAIAALREAGHPVLVTASEKEVATLLLRQLGISYRSLGPPGRGMMEKGARLALSAAKLLRIAARFRPDVLVAVSPVRAGPVAWVLRRPCIGLDDTEHAKLAHKLYMPFVTRLLTPQCYGLHAGRKHVRYAGYHELAYLHPRRFKPDPAVLLAAGVDVDTPFCLVRFVAWQAAHDVGQSGFSLAGKTRLIQELSGFGRVLISSEGEMPAKLSQYAFMAPPHQIHHFLHFAAVCVTEGATMASEAAALGTRAVYLNPLRAGTLNEQQERYGLVFNFNNTQDEDEAITTAAELMRQGCSRRQEWRARAGVMLRDHIDVTEYILDVVAEIGAGHR